MPPDPVPPASVPPASELPDPELPDPEPPDPEPPDPEPPDPEPPDPVPPDPVPPASKPPDPEAIAEQVFVALADPSRRAILAALAAGGPATATDLAGRLPITRQAIAKHLALLAEAGLVTAEPGERRRVRYRLRSAPMQVAQQFLAALARDWDGPLGALKDHLSR
jgi:DNA-binding transcriptional ArsR family regulator